VVVAIFMIKAKLYMNVHWMVLYKLYAFCRSEERRVGEAGRSRWSSDH
jgi:hypothetical protein